MKQYIFILTICLFTGCAHQPKLKPSGGHIDQVKQQGEGSKTVLTEPTVEPTKAYNKLDYPEIKQKEQTYTIVVNEVPVKEILFSLARDSKLNVDINPSISGSVTLNAVDQPLPAILERLARQVNMIYRVENKVLIIEPDNPILRNYKINYVNMERDTEGGIAVTNQLASAQLVTATGTSTPVLQNNSNTSVKSKSKNHFWETLISNVEAILQETDKQVLISRLETDVRLQAVYDGATKGKGNISVGGGKETIGTNGASSLSNNGAKGSGDQTITASTTENAEKSLNEYKTLFASRIIANRENGILSIRATQKQHEKIKEFIDLVQISAKRQVLIEASIVEITLNDQYQSGVDWSRLGANGAISGFTFQQNLLGTTLSSSPAVTIGYNKSTALGELAASIKLLQTFGNSKVLSSPKLMVLNSQTAVLKAVDNLVYFTAKAENNQNANTTIVTYTSTANTIPVGIWLSVTPQINENSEVTLNIRPTIARQIGLGVLDPNPALKIESRIPQIQVREMESMLQVNSGNTVILGGLMQDEVSRTDNGVPKIMELPGFGSLFKSRNDINKKTEIVIFLRPTVIKNASLDSEELEMYKQYLPLQQLQKVIDEVANKQIQP